MKKHLMNTHTHTHTHTHSKLGFLAVSQVFIWSRLVATWDSFNKNTSRPPLIIHHPTATGAIKWCSSINESTICSTYLFIKTMPECSPKHPSSLSYVTLPLRRAVTVLLWVKLLFVLPNRKTLENRITHTPAIHLSLLEGGVLCIGLFPFYKLISNIPYCVCSCCRGPVRRLLRPALLLLLLLLVIL